MASSDSRSVASAGVAAAVLSGAAWWFGTGLAPLPWLTWLAPLPLLLVAPRLRWQYAALAALCAGACAGLNLWHYLRHIIGLPLPVGVAVAAVPGVTFALCLLLYRRLCLKGQLGAALVAFPALWVVLDYLASRGSPHGTFGSLAYSQIDALPVVQLGSVTGIWGVSFVMLLAPAAVAVALLPGQDQRKRLIAASAGLLVVMGTFVFGYLRLQAPATDSMRIGLASLPGPVRPALASPEGQALLQRYLDAVDTLAAQGAQAIVLPETIFGTDQPSIPALAASAVRNKVIINIGVAIKNNQGERNMSLAFLPSGGAPVDYAKHHLIPGFESQYKAGTETVMLPGTQIGLTVCKDMDFHDTGRAYSDRNARLLLVPAWDFGADGYMHSRMAVMRGIESGFAVARAALRGNLTLSDDRGRIIAEASDAHGDAQLLGNLPLYGSNTLYAKWGDWFAWLSLVLLATTLLCLRRSRV